MVTAFLQSCRKGLVPRVAEMLPYGSSTKSTMDMVWSQVTY